jgi:Galactose oxidase, central domain
METLKRRFIFFYICFCLAYNSSYSQNQWAFMGGYLDSSLPSGNLSNGIGLLSPLNKPASREHCGSGIYNNKIWIFGGNGNGVGSDVWYYDIALRSWAFVSNRGFNEIFVEKNTESLTAHPGERSRMASAMDTKGNFWTFGGETKDLGYHTGWNDLWKYNTVTNNWTWIGGSSTHTSSGSYQTALPDWPRARYRARGWFDEDGNYWIFGGLFYDGINPPFPLNDMWKYNVTTAKWTCETGDCNMMHPPNTPGGVYPSTFPATSTSYKPRARADYNYWIDNDGNFIFYGGFNGEIHSGGIVLWDTWKYNPKTHEWTLLTQEGAPSGTSPGWQAEALCWLGNDGLPWMKLANRSIWKFKNGHWLPQRFEAYDTWAIPILINNQAFVPNALNQPGSQYTTFDHIKTDSAVYLFNGYGLGVNNVPNVTGALWKYNLEVFPTPKLTLNISKDDFSPNGGSPYTNSNREITIQNIGQDTAHNVVVNMGLGLQNSYSAIRLANLKVADDKDSLIGNVLISASPYLNPDPLKLLPCAFDTSIYKSSIQVTIPKMAAGKTIKISILVEHCMANFEQATSYHYTWNYWGAKLTYKNNVGKKSNIEPIFNAPANTLDAYSWSEYKAAYPTLIDTIGSSVFTIELGSGLVGNPSNNQNLGSGFANAQARLDLTLPANVYLANGALPDIIGEYAIKNGTAIQLFKVNASSILYKYSLNTGTQGYIIKFPPSQYLPIRRIFVKLRAKNPNTDITSIKTVIRTTFNASFASQDYGWKPATP